ncbi:MAG: hypothetical protein ABID63_18355 [Pseudomonadota bacterium]
MAVLDQGDFDMMAQFCGFDTAEELIRYCEAHSETERALFHHPMIGVLAAMSGKDDMAQSWLDGDGNFIGGDCSAMCKCARAHISECGVA